MSLSPVKLVSSQDLFFHRLALSRLFVCLLFGTRVIDPHILRVCVRVPGWFRRLGWRKSALLSFQRVRLFISEGGEGLGGRGEGGATPGVGRLCVVYMCVSHAASAISSAPVYGSPSPTSSFFSAVQFFFSKCAPLQFISSLHTSSSSSAVLVFLCV